MICKLCNIILHSFCNNVLSKEMRSLNKRISVSLLKLAKYSDFLKHHIELILNAEVLQPLIVASSFLIPRYIIKALEHLSHNKSSVKLSVSYVTILNDSVCNNIIYLNRVAVLINNDVYSSTITCINCKILISVDSHSVKFIHSLILV